jgi:hypothetical protein
MNDLRRELTSSGTLANMAIEKHARLRKQESMGPSKTPFSYGRNVTDSERTAA